MESYLKYFTFDSKTTYNLNAYTKTSISAVSCINIHKQFLSCINIHKQFLKIVTACKKFATDLQ